MNFTILRYHSLESTNTEAAKQARLGAEEGLCIMARSQTAGRGRHGREWISTEGIGLYFSVVLRPRLAPKFIPLITLMAGVAVFDALKGYLSNPDIKWVNDLLVGEKKIGGILAETADTPSGLAVILGIGVNLKSKNLPLELAGSATSIEAETGKHVSADEFSEHLTGYLSYFYDMLGGENGPRDIVAEWRQRSSYYSGKLVTVVLAGGVISGVTNGLESNGALRVRRGDGSVSTIQAGDVERLRSELHETQAF
ncbi:MAG: biotin--[acetyl-CoA-carboxylase] ligase [Pyrinomonadaceae bacterium]